MDETTGEKDETPDDMDETAGGMDGAVPRFAESAGPGDLTYTVGAAIDALTLPEASGGNGVLRYGLSPRVPGLMFDAATRELSGTPGTAGTYAMTYTVVDEGRRCRLARLHYRGGRRPARDGPARHLQGGHVVEPRTAVHLPRHGG